VPIVQPYYISTCLDCCPGGLTPSDTCMMRRGCQTAHGKAINISDRGGKGRTKRTRCEQPFHSKYKNHVHKTRRIMFERVQAYILQHLDVSASDPLSLSKSKLLSAMHSTLVGNALHSLLLMPMQMEDEYSDVIARQSKLWPSSTGIAPSLRTGQ
jgi:uncharacterized C2H2 Zn-finger protein